MKTKLIATLLLAGSSLFAETHFSFGVSLGGPRYFAPAPVIAPVYRPPAPGPGYVWIDGYTDAYGVWVNGYWALPPYAGAYWIAPRHDRGRFIAGYWGGTHHVDRNVFHSRESHRSGFHDSHGYRGSDRGHTFNRSFRH